MKPQKLICSKAPSLSPSPVKSKRKIAISTLLRARPILRTARKFLLQVKQCAKSENPKQLLPAFLALLLICNPMHFQKILIFDSFKIDLRIEKKIIKAGGTG